MIIYILLIISIIILITLLREVSVRRDEYIDIHNKIVDIEHKLDKVFPEQKD